MDYEKKYKELIERFDVLLNLKTVKESGTLSIEDIKKSIPELAESEDEKIRKRIIHALHGDVLDVEEINKAIAWLEKQGEPVEINPTEFDTRLQALLKEFESLPKKELESSLAFYLNVIQNDGTYKSDEKQGEQKLVDSDNILKGGDIVVDKHNRVFFILANVAERNYKEEYSTYCESLLLGVDGCVYCNNTDLVEFKKANKEERAKFLHDLKVGIKLKQKPVEMKSAEESLGISSEEYNKIVDECIYGEHNHTEKVKPITEGLKTEFQKQVSYLITSVMNREYEYTQGYVEWVAQSLLGYAQHEQKPEWSKEDEKMKKQTISCLITHINSHTDSAIMGECIDWLKSLKDRVQPKQEWSEEDDKTLKEIISDVKFEGYNNDMQADSYKKINWLKSLRPQSHWKPSDEQMNALSVAVKHGQTDDPDALKKLLEQLKKLKEE